MSEVLDISNGKDVIRHLSGEGIEYAKTFQYLSLDQQQEITEILKIIDEMQQEISRLEKGLRINGNQHQYSSLSPEALALYGSQRWGLLGNISHLRSEIFRILFLADVGYRKTHAFPNTLQRKIRELLQILKSNRKSPAEEAI